MHPQRSLAAFLLATCLLPARAEKAVISPAAAAAEAQAYAPVNQGTRFLLSNPLPYLSGSFSSGAASDMVTLRIGEFQRQDRTLVTQLPEAKGKKGAWVQMNNYWIEPVTPPPSQGDAMMVSVDDMRVAEVQGDVSLTEFSDRPTRARPVQVNEDMEVPEAATLSTTDNGSVAVIVGGHTSIRLVPNSRIQFHYDVSGLTPRLEVKILKGAVFCKVGKLSTGRVPDVGVRGKVGLAANIGSSDFFVQSDPVSLHVCLVRGRLLVGDAIPLAVGNMDWYPADAEATAESGPRICHWPKPSAKEKTLADSRILGFALREADQLNVKIKTLLEVDGSPVSSEDQAYLGQIPRVTWYAQATAVP